MVTDGTSSGATSGVDFSQRYNTFTSTKVDMHPLVIKPYLSYLHLVTMFQSMTNFLPPFSTPIQYGHVPRAFINISNTGPIYISAYTIPVYVHTNAGLLFIRPFSEMLNKNYPFIRKNTFENFVCKMAAISFQLHLSWWFIHRFKRDLIKMLNK